MDRSKLLAHVSGFVACLIVLGVAAIGWSAVGGHLVLVKPSDDPNKFPSFVKVF